MDIQTLITELGLPVAMLCVAVYGIVKLFNWLANDLMVQIKNNEQRIESIVIKLIDNSKKERELNRESNKEILTKITTIVDLMVKLTGNGLKKKGKE